MTPLPEADNELFINLVTANYEQLRRYVFTLLPNQEADTEAHGSVRRYGKSSK
jgi:hypothetical protein